PSDLYATTANPAVAVDRPATTTSPLGAIADSETDGQGTDGRRDDPVAAERRVEVARRSERRWR
ncbi:MAG TPA: hypothetical protein VNN79_15290, partial [Actinomycetota bacterium]|nr:hypothetical protein [Actinomycetota bacterium]